MEFSDTTNKLGIIEDITFKTGVTTSQYTLTDRTRNINNWYMKVTGWVFTADGRWQWDDSNHTDFAIATTDIVTDQADYNIISATPDTDQDWLVEKRVEMADSGGTFYTLYPFAKKDEGSSITQDQTTSGTPSRYRFEGTQIILDAVPSYNYTDGLKIWFDRAPLMFASTDTTKKPGFASIFHEILSLGATYEWEKYKKTGDSEQTMRDIMTMKANIKTYYGDTRKGYENKMLKRAYKSYK